MQKAREYIEAHLREQVRVDAICRYAGTTLKSLERVFARELGMSPQKYVKIRRLNEAHHLLWHTTSRQDIRIADVAIGCGFVHLGRFSVDYRRYFGELPRETLQRHR